MSNQYSFYLQAQKTNQEKILLVRAAKLSIRIIILSKNSPARAFLLEEGALEGGDKCITQVGMCQHLTFWVWTRVAKSQFFT
jgi:hypothetical protein